MVKPAEGILKRQPFSDAHSYLIECDCTSPDHNVEAWIEIEGEEDVREVGVTFYMEWSYRPWRGLLYRAKTAWQVLWGGQIKVQHDIYLKPEAAKNFAEALENSVQELQEKIDNS